MRDGGTGRWKLLVMRTLFCLLNILLVLVIIASINFAIFRTYGDGRWLVPSHNTELQYMVIEELRLDESIPVQYFDYLASTLTGDFYKSTGVRKFADVESFIYDNALGTIFLLTIVSTASILLGMAWGSCMKKNAEKAYGRFLHVLAVSFLSFPVPYLAMSLLIAALHLEIDVPLWGNGFDQGFVGIVQHAILPILSLMAAGSGFFALVTRAALQRAERLGDGARPFRALDYVDPFPYFLLPLVMIGVLTVDHLFSYDGLGTLVWDAILSRDVPVLMACFFVISAVVFFSQIAFRAVRERRRFMHTIDGILGPSKGIGSQNAFDLRHEPRERLSISLIVSESKKLAGAYLRHKPGVAAVVVLAIFLALGWFAAILSTVPDPLNIDNYEPVHIVDDWFNPLPPSLSPSPYSGFLHPLGTDIHGRDLYSMNLYAAGDGMAVVLWTCAISVLCGLFVGFLSIVFAHYMGMLSRLRRHSMAIISQSFLAILAPLILLCILVTPNGDSILSDTNQILTRTHFAIFLLTLSVYCWVYRTITWPLSDSLRSVKRARRWNEAGEIFRGSINLFRCYSPLVLSKTLHVTKYVVVLMFVFSFAFHMSHWLHPFDLSWDSLLESAFSYGAFHRGWWWWIVPPLVGIVIMAVSSYFCIDTLERVFEEQAESHATPEQNGEETPGSDRDAIDGQDEAELDVPTSTAGSSE